MWHILDEIAVGGGGECVGGKLFLMNLIRVYLTFIFDVGDSTKRGGTHEYSCNTKATASGDDGFWVFDELIFDKYIIGIVSILVYAGWSLDVYFFCHDESCI